MTIKSFDFFEQIRNKYLIALLSFIIYVSLLRWFVFVYSYGHFLVLIFIFLLSINIVRGVVDPKKLKTVAVSSLIIFSFLCALVAFPFKNVQIYEDSDSYSGKFNIASQDLDRSLWVDNSLSGNFLASSSDIRNSLWLYSDSQSAANHHNITNFLILSETLEVSLNFSLLYTSGQKTFDEDLDSRYNPKRIEEKIFLNNEKDLASLYAVNFIVIDKFESSTCEIKTCKYESDFVKDTRDLKYRVFSDNRVNMYHYES